MPREFPRTRRVGEQIQRELAGLIRSELKDPRLGMVSISGVTVSRDLSHARVHVSVLGDEAQAVASLKTLQHAAGFLRHRLGQTMRMRVIPELHFAYDSSLDEGMRVSALLDTVAAERKDSEK